MLIVMAFCEKDWQQTVDWFNWVRELDGQYLRHQCLLIAERTLAREKYSAVYKSAHEVFPKTEIIRPSHADPRERAGWPAACNIAWELAIQYVKTRAKCPYYWLESDAIPLKPGWLDTLESEYVASKKPFMGCVYDNPFDHLTGVAIYPPNLDFYNPSLANPGVKNWDLLEPAKTIPHVHPTDLYHHEWGDDVGWTFPDQDSLSKLRPDAVLFHRNKDGTLINQLRYRLNHPILSAIKKAGRPPKQKPSALSLPDVTLVAVDGRPNPKLTEKSLALSASKANFGAIKFFATRQPFAKPDLYKTCEFVKLPQVLDIHGYNRFILGELHKHIKTSHCLTIQADSCIVNPEAWDPAWLEYDYIGAPWPPGHTMTPDDIRMGNSGFCLRSKRLLEATSTLPTSTFQWRGKAYRGCLDDVLTCIMFRKQLEAQGMKFAPVSVASKFAFESPTPESACLNGQFGRHEFHQVKT